jgi:hypothetical protein
MHGDIQQLSVRGWALGRHPEDQYTEILEIDLAAHFTWVNESFGSMNLHAWQKRLTRLSSHIWDQDYARPDRLLKWR